MFDEVIDGIRGIFGHPTGPIPLHAPWFDKEDEEAVAACVRSTYVSSVGAEITAFEQDLVKFTGAAHAVAVVNGTAALHTALMLAECGPNDLVITQPFTFIATCNLGTSTGCRARVVGEALHNEGERVHSFERQTGAGMCAYAQFRSAHAHRCAGGGVRRMEHHRDRGCS